MPGWLNLAPLAVSSQFSQMSSQPLEIGTVPSSAGASAGFDACLAIRRVVQPLAAGRGLPQVPSTWNSLSPTGTLDNCLPISIRT